MSCKGKFWGNRLYAGLKSMFKGHMWQRMMETRRMPVKSMKRKVLWFKSVRSLLVVLVCLSVNVAVVF